MPNPESYGGPFLKVLELALGLPVVKFFKRAKVTKNLSYKRKCKFGNYSKLPICQTHFLTILIKLKILNIPNLCRFEMYKLNDLCT